MRSLGSTGLRDVTVMLKDILRRADELDVCFFRTVFSEFFSCAVTPCPCLCAHRAIEACHEGHVGGEQQRLVVASHSVRYGLRALLPALFLLLFLLSPWFNDGGDHGHCSCKLQVSVVVSADAAVAVAVALLLLLPLLLGVFCVLPGVLSTSQIGASFHVCKPT